MWFLVVLFTPHENSTLSRAMAMQSYPTHAACMSSAAERVEALAQIEMHGRYLCMRHREPDAQLAATEKREF